MKKYPVGDHSVFFVRPGRVHRLVLESGSKGYLMRMSSGFYRFRRAGRKNAYSGEFKKLFAVLADIFEEYTEKRERFQEVISDCVVLEAKRHLLATATQVSQIAWDLGYGDVSYFIRFF